MLSGCPKTYRIFWGAGLSARRGCWWRLRGSFGPGDDASDLAGFVPVEVDEAVGLMSVGVAVSGTHGVAEVVEDEAAVLDETPLLGDLAVDEGPVIVSDDAVVTVVAAEAAEILGLEPESAVVAAEVVVEQVREELTPDLDRVVEERERIRAEERAELQRQYD